MIEISNSFFFFSIVLKDHEVKGRRVEVKKAIARDEMRNDRGSQRGGGGRDRGDDRRERGGRGGRDDYRGKTTTFFFKV